MLFSAGGRRYAIPVDTLDGIADLLPEYPIPGAPRFLRGVVNVHGKIVTVLDLSLYVGTGPVHQGSNLILLSLPDTSLAVLVEQTGRMILADEIVSTEAAEEEFETETFILADGRAGLLALEQLVTSIEKTLAA
jgi:chemotaxis signal transduction protein